jgi:hypothetical protein
MTTDEREAARDRLLVAIGKVLLQQPIEFHPKAGVALNEMRVALAPFELSDVASPGTEG